MEMHQIRYFLAVAETLNFTRAAELCNVTQPSLTRAVKKLEEELGGLLFSREHHNTHLTELGQLMRPHLEAIWSTEGAARALAKGYCRLEQATLRLGVMCTISPMQMVELLGRLHEQVPNLDLTLVDAPAREVVEQLEAGEVVMALVALPEFPEKCHARPLFTERYMIAFPRGHRFERMNAVPFHELDGEDYLQRLHCEFRYHFEALDVPKRHKTVQRYRSEREEWIQAMLLAGRGCAVMPEYLPVLPGISMRPIVEPEVSRTVNLLTIAGRRFTPVAEIFARLVQRHPWTAQPAPAEVPEPVA